MTTSGAAVGGAGMTTSGAAVDAAGLTTSGPAPLVGGTTASPSRLFDVALLDLDGVVYVGPQPVSGAPAALAAAREAGMRLGFVTNNAARPPEAVAAHLAELDIPADVADVITSAQAAASVVAGRFGPGARVLALGGPGVAAALAGAGLTPVTRAEEEPVAVVQGYGPDVAWTHLAEAVVAVRNGAVHVATNADATLPSPRGVLPGNGALVGVVSAVTGQQPIIAGKPDPAMHAECVRRTGALRPLVVGDRLDTDIEGARRAGAHSLLVLSGVTDPAALLAAGPGQRPDLLAADLAGLLGPHPAVRATDAGWACGSWTVTAPAGCLVLAHRSARVEEADALPADDGLDGLRALCVAHWSRFPAGGAPACLRAGDEAAAEALTRWRLPLS